MLDAKQIEKELSELHVGAGATKHVGSDCYPFYITEVRLVGHGRPLIGMYEADSHFEHSWTDGHEVVDPFDPTKKAQFYLTLWRKNWYLAHQDGSLVEPHQKDNYAFGYAAAYQDPSF